MTNKQFNGKLKFSENTTDVNPGLIVPFIDHNIGHIRDQSSCSGLITQNKSLNCLTRSRAVLWSAEDPCLIWDDIENSV